MRRAALLHDVGKLAISNRILDKPARLTEEEYALVRRHPLYTSSILGRTPGFSGLAPLAGAHHERLDGSGYPEGLRGDELSLELRILGVCDVYDALSSQRVYRRAYDQEQALAILHQGSGSSFDPVVLDALSRVVGAAPLAGLRLAA
jgi:HD-GYP domain-containing protein (c-di-GMP phosphodiesterase class II)